MQGNCFQKDSLNFVIAKVKPPLSITCRYPRVKSRLKSLLCPGLEESINAEPLAGLCSQNPFPQDCFVPAPGLTVPIAKGGAAWTARTAITTPSLCGMEQLLKSDTSRSQSGFTESHSRKHQFSFFQLSLQTLGNPSNSTSACHF